MPIYVDHGANARADEESNRRREREIQNNQALMMSAIGSLGNLGMQVIDMRRRDAQAKAQREQGQAQFDSEQARLREQFNTTAGMQRDRMSRDWMESDRAWNAGQEDRAQVKADRATMNSELGRMTGRPMDLPANVAGPVVQNRLVRGIDQQAELEASRQNLRLLHDDEIKVAQASGWPEEAVLELAAARRAALPGAEAFLKSLPMQVQGGLVTPEQAVQIEQQVRRYPETHENIRASMQAMVKQQANDAVDSQEKAQAAAMYRARAESPDPLVSSDERKRSLEIAVGIEMGTVDLKEIRRKEVERMFGVSASDLEGMGVDANVARVMERTNTKPTAAVIDATIPNQDIDKDPEVQNAIDNYKLELMLYEKNTLNGVPVKGADAGVRAALKKVQEARGKFSGRTGVAQKDHLDSVPQDVLEKVTRQVRSELGVNSSPEKIVAEVRRRLEAQMPRP